MSNLRTLAVVAGLAVTSVASAGGLPGNVLVVSDSASAGGNGLAWGTAFNTIQAAVDAALASGGVKNEVWVETGTYRPTRSFNSTPAPNNTPVFSLEIRGNVRVYGGFAGTESSLSERDFSTNPVTIRPIDPANGRSGVVVRVYGNGVLDGVQILDVGANQPTERRFNGVAVFDSGVLRNIRIQGDVAGTDAALLAAAGTARIENFEIGGGSTDSGHAGVRIAGNVRMVNGEISSGINTNGSAGVWVFSGSPTLSRVDVTNTTGRTAAVRATPGTTLINCTIAGNENNAPNPAGTAGVVGGTLINCLVSNNRSVGGLAAVRGARVINSTIFNNSVRGVIGGSVANSIIWGNGGTGENGVLAGQFSGLRPNALQYTIVQGLSTTPDSLANLGSDPLLGSNGRPGTGSPAIDSGNNDLVPRGIFRDLDGRRRFSGTTTPATGAGLAPRVDRGAIEVSDSTNKGLFCYANFNDDTTLNASDQAAFTALFNIGHPLADANADGVVNAADQTRFTELTAAGCP